MKNNENDLWQATNIRSLKTNGFETDLIFDFKNATNLKLGYAFLEDDTYINNISFSK